MTDNRQLDIEIATEIFGWTDIATKRLRDREFAVGIVPKTTQNKFVPYYSTLIEDAWLIIDKVKQLGLAAGISWWKDSWMACIGKHDDPFNWRWWKSNTAEEAICRCILKAHRDGLLDFDTTGCETVTEPLKA